MISHGSWTWGSGGAEHGEVLRGVRYLIASTDAGFTVHQTCKCAVCATRVSKLRLVEQLQIGLLI